MQAGTNRHRIVALDILRGYFLIVILIDHLGLFPSPFEFLSGRGLLWASAAEGFFLISGLLVGYIYTPRMVRSFRDTATKLFKRAALLYAWAVGIVWSMVAWGNHLAEPETKSGLWIDPPLGELLYKSLTLQYSYGWADYLQYYAVYMLFAPIALWLCLRGKVWLLLAISCVIWLFRGESFMVAWQFLFTIGIVIGFYLPTMQEWYKALPESRRKILVVTVAFLTIATIIFSALTNRLAVFLVETYPSFSLLPSLLQSTSNWLFDTGKAIAPWNYKWTLEPLRIVIALLWFSAFYLCTRRYEAAIDRWTWGSVRLIGSASLLVYIFQAYLVFIVLLFVSPGSVVRNTLVTAGCILLTYVVARYYQYARDMTWQFILTGQVHLRGNENQVGKK